MIRIRTFLQKSILDGRQDLERGLLKGFGRTRQLSLNKFFDPSTPSMRKGRDGGEKSEMKKNKHKICA